MILSSLVSYYEALVSQGKLMRPGWSVARVSYAVLLRPDGSIRAFVCLKREEERGKKTVLAPVRLYVPTPVVRTAGIQPNFLCDTAAYLLGYPAGDGKAPQKFAAARELHLRILAQATSEAAVTLRRFFETHTPGATVTPAIPDDMAADFEKGATLTFADEDGRYLMEDEAVIAAWDAHYSGGGEHPVEGRCLVTGRTDQIAILHDKIKGVPGAQSSGAALVGFNAPAFESYGHDGGQGLNAPVGRYAMSAYTAALNYLLAHQRGVRIGDTTVLSFMPDADDASTDFFDAFLYGNDDETVLTAVMDRIRRGLPPDLPEATLQKPFCILGLSPNAARLSVRFFYRDSFGAFLRNIAAHYERLSIEKPAGSRRHLTPFPLLLETTPPNVRDRAGAISPLLGGALLSAILNDWRYPEALYETVLSRIRAEHDITPGKAAIIKAYLLKNTDCERYREVLTMALNEQSNNRAYVLGRLFAALENAQYNANKSSNLKERYLSSACATPGLVFPTMLRMSVHHTEKSGNVADARLIAALMDKLEGGVPFPVRLNNTEQGLFLEGYYHQMRDKFRRIEEAKQNKENSEEA